MNLEEKLQYLTNLNNTVWPEYTEYNKANMDHHISKLLEECGELAGEFSKNWGRKLDPEKLTSHSKIEAEWGDCLSHLLVIASVAGINPARAVDETITKIQLKASNTVKRRARDKWPPLCFRCNGQVLVNGTCPNCSVYTG